MNREAWYEAWLRRRAEESAPAGFADRVMAALAEETARRRRSLLGALLVAAWSARWGRIGMCSLAAAACAFRLLHVVALFIAQ